MRRVAGFFLVCTLALAWPSPLRAARVPYVPEPLRPWGDWVLHDHEEARCPFLSGQAGRRGGRPARRGQ